MIYSFGFDLPVSISRDGMASYCCSFSYFLQSRYTVLSSFLLPFPCISWFCCSLPCISQFLQVRIFSFSVLSCRSDQEFLQWPRFFSLCRCLQGISLVVPVIAVLKVVIVECMSASLLLMMVRGANLPSIIAWKVSNTLRSFNFSRSNSVNLVFWLGRSSLTRRGHFQCLPLENFVFWQCSLLIGSASSLECNQSNCGVVHLGYARSIFWMLCDDKKMFASTRSLKVPNSRSLNPLSLCHHCRRVHKCLASFHKHSCPPLHSSLLAQQEYPLLSDQWPSVVGHRMSSSLQHAHHHLPEGSPFQHYSMRMLQRQDTCICLILTILTW